MQKAYLELVRRIRDAVREKVQDIPTFRNSGNGCIRILAYPCCPAADSWLGGLSNFEGETPDIVDYEHTFAIAPGGSRVITTIQYGVRQKVDTYAYSALKIAHCSYSQDEKGCLLSGIIKAPHQNEGNGYGPYLGALCAEVKICPTTSNLHPTGEPYDFCGIYVCVSGASQVEDLECAFAAVKVIKRFFAGVWHGGFFEVNAPEFPAEYYKEVD